MILQQPDFLKMIQDVQKNPDNMNQYLTDPHMMQVLSVLLNVNLRTATLEEDSFEQSSSPRPQPKRTPEPQPESKPELMDIPDEAQREKELGNAAYKKKYFETAIQHYTKAMDLDDEGIFYITNRASCYTNIGALPEGLKDVNKCIELDPSFTKGYSRKDVVQFFMKEYDKAMELIRKVSNMMKTTRNY